MAAGFAPIGKYTITYTDGHTEAAQSNFAGLIAIERRWAQDQESPAIEAIAMAVWHYIGCPGDFEQWAETVHTIEPIGDEASDLPTQPAVGAA